MRTFDKEKLPKKTLSKHGINKKMSNNTKLSHNSHNSEINQQKIKLQLDDTLCKCASTKEHWKVIPKDSCEVYRDRRSRCQCETRQNVRSQSKESNLSSQGGRKANRRRREKKRVPGKKSDNKRIRNKRLASNTSLSSNSTTGDSVESYYCTHCNSYSTSTTSDMDYDSEK